jgi:hypothetical protein
MTEKLGQVSRSAFEDIWVSLRDIHGEPHVELRVYSRGSPFDATPLPGLEEIVVPVNQLPALLRELREAQELLSQRGLIQLPSTAPTTLREREEPITVGWEAPPTGGPTETVTVRRAPPPDRKDPRQYPRVPLNLPVECRLVDPDSFWPGKPITGEILDVSLGGAKVGLPQPLPRYGQVEVFVMIKGSLFRARAEIVGAERERKKDLKGRYYRHSLRWVMIDAQAQVALSKVVPPA